MNCEHCEKEFSTKSSLSYHQKTAKYCLEKQGKSNEQYKCSHCEKCFTTLQRLNEHQKQSCKLKDKVNYDQEINRIKDEFGTYKKQEKIKLKEKETFYLQQLKEKETSYQQQLKDKENSYQQQLKDKDTYSYQKDIQIASIEKALNEKNEYIAKLEAKLEKLEAKLDSKLEKLESVVTTMAIEAKTLSATSASTTTTNNTTNNITVTNNNVLNLSKEHVNKVLKDHLDYDVVYAGQAGFAKFVVDKMLKGPDGKLTYKCVDPSRQMFEFIDESGETVRDMRAEKLIQSLLDGDALKIGLDAAAKGWNTDDRQLNNARTETFGPRVNEYSELNRHNTVFRNKVSSLTT